MAKEMTNKEAIKFLKGYLDDETYTDKCREAHSMAIQALEQSPCEDAISRRKVFSAIHNTHLPKQYEEPLWNKISDLPSVTPIRPKGEWKYDKTIQNWRCSKCNETPKTLGYVGTKEFMTEHFKFCNHCGADMRGDKDAT